MVLGQYLQDDVIKACHIYKPSWPAETGAELKLDVNTAAKMFSAHKKIESAFDKFRLIIVPNFLVGFHVAYFGPFTGF
ncbi:hypothetical protein WJX77_004484 [Trebouxia sp. C0004]